MLGICFLVSINLGNLQSGAISIVCATSTLAAGVNLPARRVIIRSPKIGISFMTKAQFLQMAGRAGRAGFDDVGECYVIANEGREKVVSICTYIH